MNPSKTVSSVTIEGTLPWRNDQSLTAHDERGVSPRLGVVLNYEPRLALYVSEPFEDRIAVIVLDDDGEVFRVEEVFHIDSPWLNHPVDLAPAEIETEDPDWASNTTLEEGADFYVANRGNNTIVRMRQDGSVAAVRRVVLEDGQSLGDARLNGIGVRGAPSADRDPFQEFQFSLTHYQGKSK